MTCLWTSICLKENLLVNLSKNVYLYYPFYLRCFEISRKQAKKRYFEVNYINWNVTSSVKYGKNIGILQKCNSTVWCWFWALVAVRKFREVQEGRPQIQFQRIKSRFHCFYPVSSGSVTTLLDKGCVIADTVVPKTNNSVVVLYWSPYLSIAILKNKSFCSQQCSEVQIDDRKDKESWTAIKYYEKGEKN